MENTFVFEKHTYFEMQQVCFIESYELENILLNCWKWACAPKIFNQIDCGTAIDFHVSHTASTVTTGGFRGLRPPKQCTKPPEIETWKL